MILTCPECSTRYQANDAAFLPAGRRVRCAKCGHAWHQEPPQAEADADFESRPEPAPSPAPVRTAEEAPLRAAPIPPSAGADWDDDPQPPRGSPAERMAVLGGWLGLVVVIVLIGWAAANYRQEIATLWPQSASLYKALGMPVNTRGIAFTDVRYAREREDKQTVLAVAGKLVNVSGRELAVPPIRVVLSGENGQELYHWDFTPDVNVLHAGQSAAFRTRLSGPPNGARHLTLEFADAKG